MIECNVYVDEDLVLSYRTPVVPAEGQYIEGDRATGEVFVVLDVTHQAGWSDLNDKVLTKLIIDAERVSDDDLYPAVSRKSARRRSNSSMG